MTQEANIILTFDDGSEDIDSELALARLLNDGKLFCNTFDYGRGGKVWGETISLLVSCNDLFAWGMTDSADIRTSELLDLYKMHLADPKWGTDKWCCFKRNQKPQAAVEAAMRTDGVWDKKMEALPENHFSSMMRANMER